MDDSTYMATVWKCMECGITKPATVHQMRQKTCSKICMAATYRRSLTGTNNPNYKNALAKQCQKCGLPFNSYNKTRKFCSHNCYSSSNIKPKTPKQVTAKQTKICSYCQSTFACNKTSKKTTCSEECAAKLRESKRLYRNCAKCNIKFQHFKSQSRIYCSYQCHLDSGGAFRAGLASAEATLRYGPRKDANHNEVIAEMRKHCAVYDLSTAGMGVPDGVAWINEAWHLFDIKNPKTGYGRRGLNKVQKKWLEHWTGGPVYLIYTEDEAARFAQGQFDGLRFAKGGIVEEDQTLKEA